MIHLVNLTNGLEAIDSLDALQLPYSFTRIQSTFCEQQRFEQLLVSLDSNFLLYLALGRPVMVWDYGSRSKSGLPRAVWYGLEFVRFALNRFWLGYEVARTLPPPILRGNNLTVAFEQHCRAMSSGTERKIRYYGKFANHESLIRDGGVRVYGAYRITVHDPDFNWYYRTARAYFTKDDDEIEVEGDKGGVEGEEGEAEGEERVNQRISIIDAAEVERLSAARRRVLGDPLLRAADDADVSSSSSSSSSMQRTERLAPLLDQATLHGHPAVALRQVGHYMFAGGMMHHEFKEYAREKRREAKEAKRRSDAEIVREP